MASACIFVPDTWGPAVLVKTHEEHVENLYLLSDYFNSPVNIRPTFRKFFVLLYKKRCSSYLGRNGRHTFHFFRLISISV